MTGRGDTSAGYDAVQVGMQGEVLSPGVQHGDHAGIGPQVSGIRSEGCHHTQAEAKRASYTRSGAYRHSRLSSAGRVKTRWKYGTGRSSALRAETQSSRAKYLALGAMTVSAAVVADAQVGAGRTLIDVPAHGRGSAIPNQAQVRFCQGELPAAFNVFPSCPMTCATSQAGFTPFGKERIQRTEGRFTPVARHVEIDHRGLDALVPQQFFDGNDIQTVFQRWVA